MKAFNPYNNLSHLTRELKVLLPKPKEDWRLVSPSPIGEIHGLPNMRGIVVATNGILCLLVTPPGAVLFGHLEWFLEDHDICPAPFRPLPGQHREVDLTDYV